MVFLNKLKQQLEEFRDSIKKEANDKRTVAFATGLCAFCGTKIPESRFKRGSYTCSSSCVGEFQRNYDYSMSSDLIRNRKKELKSHNPKKEMTYSGTSTARVKDYCDLCEYTILPGDRYHWKIPAIWDDDYDPDKPFSKYKDHIECLDNLFKIAKEIFHLYTDEGLSDEIKPIFDFAKLHGGLKNFNWQDKISEKEINRFLAIIDNRL